jgi:hypothetical protein
MGIVTTFNRSSAASEYAEGKAYQYSDGNYIMGLEVFHGLHCVDTLRKFLWPDHYKQIDPEDQQELHKRKYPSQKKATYHIILTFDQNIASTICGSKA